MERWNKKGNITVTIFGIMIGVIVIVMALAFAKPVQQVTGNARDAISGMNCSSDNISNYDKGACIATDVMLPMFVLGLVGIGIFLFTRKAIVSR